MKKQIFPDLDAPVNPSFSWYHFYLYFSGNITTNRPEQRGEADTVQCSPRNRAQGRPQNNPDIYNKTHIQD